MKRAIALLSGGLDSVTSLAMTRPDHDVTLALTFDYGQRAASHEIETAKYFCQLWDIQHQVMQLTWLKEITHTALVDRNTKLEHQSAKAVWVPNRNGLFINIAAAFCEAHGIDAIIAGFNLEEAADFPDNSAQFVDKMNDALELSTLNHPKIHSPTLKLSKKDIVAKAIELGVDLKRVWPCYEGFTKLCGRCPSCEKTIKALKDNGVFEEYKEIF